MGESSLIFVTVGSGLQGFDRLLREIDHIANSLNQRIVVQVANSSYDLKHVESFRFLPRDEIRRYYENAQIIISHAGIGSIVTALSLEKPLIIVPRRKEFGELVDDHQVEIAKELERERKAIVVWDIKELMSAIISVKENDGFSNKKSELSEQLNAYLCHSQKSLLKTDETARIRDNGN